MHPANAKRADWAADALNPFAVVTFGRRLAALGAEDRADCLADLLSDLRHWAMREGMDFAEIDGRASAAFDYENAPGYAGD